MHRIAAGDESAMDDLLAAYGGLVWSLARKFCYDHAECDDAVQDVFFALWQSAARFDPSIAAEDTFVSMVARRRLIDRRRRHARQSAGLTEADVSLQAAPPSRDDADEPAARNELFEHALNALGQLKPEQQRCLRLSIERGLSHDQISQATGLPLGTVKTHVRRGLIALREELQRHIDIDAGDGEEAVFRNSSIVNRRRLTPFGRSSNDQPPLAAPPIETKPEATPRPIASKAPRPANTTPNG